MFVRGVVVFICCFVIGFMVIDNWFDNLCIRVTEHLVRAEQPLPRGFAQRSACSAACATALLRLDHTNPSQTQATSEAPNTAMPAHGTRRRTNSAAVTNRQTPGNELQNSHLPSSSRNVANQQARNPSGNSQKQLNRQALKCGIRATCSCPCGAAELLRNA